MMGNLTGMDIERIREGLMEQRISALPTIPFGSYQRFENQSASWTYMTSEIGERILALDWQGKGMLYDLTIQLATTTADYLAEIELDGNVIATVPFQQIPQAHQFTFVITSRPNQYTPQDRKIFLPYLVEIQNSLRVYITLTKKTTQTPMHIVKYDIFKEVG